MVLSKRSELEGATHEAGLQFRCGRCGEIKDVKTSGGTGYGYADDSPDAVPLCYACCGLCDREQMVKTGEYTLYLNERDREVTNWPGTLRFGCSVSRGSRYVYVRFTGPDGKEWLGRKGARSDSQLINVRRAK